MNMRLTVLLECVLAKLGPKRTGMVCAECQVLYIVALYGVLVSPSCALSIPRTAHTLKPEGSSWIALQ